MTWSRRRTPRARAVTILVLALAAPVAIGVSPAAALVPPGSASVSSPVPAAGRVTAQAAVRSGLSLRTPAAPGPRKAPPYTGRGFTLGDSVMKGARVEVAARNYLVDAVGSRQPSAGYTALRAYGSRLPGLVVIHMGTNGGITREWFDKYMALLGPSRRVVWVTLQLRDDYTRYTYEDSSNAVIREAVKHYPNARLLDWNRLSQNHQRDWFWADGIHLQPVGRLAFARLIDSVARR